MTDLTCQSTSGISDTSLTPEKQELIPGTQEESMEVELHLDLQPLSKLANHQKVTIPRNPHFTRKDVVHAFQSAFELIGGVPRLAVWANEHETEFYKLYSRLLPSQASSALGESNTLRIEMAVRPGPLDE
jgi:hypothetical protein